MYKFGQNKNVIKLIKIILETIINHDITHDFLNIGILNLLVKDAKAGHDDVNNIRPITISDTLTSIYENILLIELNKTHSNKEEKFGFKSNASCDHAVSALKEVILFNKRKKKVSFVFALDASKVFDKISRNFLWNSMSQSYQSNDFKSVHFVL